jgi:hypothetical protein
LVTTAESPVDRVWIVELDSGRYVYDRASDARYLVKASRFNGDRAYLLGEYRFHKPRKRKRTAGKRGGR